MQRRTFIKNITLGSVLAGMPLGGLLTSGCSEHIEKQDEFRSMVRDLLRDWCDGMIKHQIIKPDSLGAHGALSCPSCQHIHGRCMDAVYPFLYMADETGDKKYLDAAMLAMEWAENNVSQADGSWTVIPNPKSWKGISVFGAIALGEALHYHGHVLDKATYNSWKIRLGRVAEYIYNTFSIDFTNVNYGFTAIYALHLIGKELNEPRYSARSKQLAKEVKNYFTEPNKLLWGEAKPIDKRSQKNLLGVDLGYNVEESLNSIVLYALDEKDEELLALLDKSLASHMEFMLPDGGWDNTWGTRHNKWSYWGSRTTDGCQVGYGMMASRNQAFGRVAYQNTKLLKECTAGGLLHGGPHYISHGVKPCIHHTFAHAKPLATLLDAGKKLPKISPDTPLPCENNYGVKEFPEISTWLVSNNVWRATVTSYDALYHKTLPVQQATGGALSMLYHHKVGLLFAASMARYIIVEKNNQQLYDGEEFALTPRVEVRDEGEWYTNLYDLEAKVGCTNAGDMISFNVNTEIQNEARHKLPGNNSTFSLNYNFIADKLEIVAKASKGNTYLSKGASLVLPLASVNKEKVMQVAPHKIEILKPQGKVVLEATVPIWIKPTDKGRVFNLVPGVEAVPVYARFQKGMNELKVNIWVENV
ncbi:MULTISPECIES: hypothetical protein [unclassified Saccharicrinis]|uniref:hypothetical protein n=1 Tax=unclassified Saccharicrinis TaxID=2646859 RepID=UPI003D32B9E5